MDWITLDETFKEIMKKAIDTIIKQKMFRLNKYKDETGKWFIKDTPENIRKHFEDMFKEFVCEYDLYKTITRQNVY